MQSMDGSCSRTRRDSFSIPNQVRRGVKHNTRRDWNAEGTDGAGPSVLWNSAMKLSKVGTGKIVKALASNSRRRGRSASSSNNWVLGSRRRIARGNSAGPKTDISSRSWCG